MAGPGDTVCSVADPVGLSIGTTNLVAARAGTQPVTRRSVLTLYGHRPPEVGLPAENPNLTEPGLVMRGFVERVGDPVPLVASDGSSYLADRLLVDALAPWPTLSARRQTWSIAVPAYWGSATVRALSEALARDRKLAPAGVAAAPGLRCRRRADRPADRAGPDRRRCRRAARLRWQRHQHHAGRRRRWFPPDRRDRALSGVLR